jgi:hypothetical protein
MEPLLVAIIGVGGVLAGTAVWAPYRTIRCATALMLMAAFFCRSSRSVFSMGRRTTSFQPCDVRRG